MKTIMSIVIAFSFLSATPKVVDTYEELAYSEEVKKKKRKKGKKISGKNNKKKKGNFSKVFGSK